MYFVIFKKKSEDKYKLYSNTNIFSEEKEAKRFAKKSMKRNEQYKVVEYTIENIDDYGISYIYN